MITDASPFAHRVIAHGTAVVEGYSGSARLFDGAEGFLAVSDVREAALGFSQNQSFTVDCRFKTVDPGHQIMLRKGLAPIPGFALDMKNGRVRGLIGNRQDGMPYDTILTIRSERTYNDGQWHRATMVRDRPRRAFFLYVDDEAANAPMEDYFGEPLVNGFDLNIGRWEFDSAHVAYFNGSLDDIGIYRGTRHPPGALRPRIVMQDSMMAFHTILVGETERQSLTVENAGTEDLHVRQIHESMTDFTVLTPSAIPAMGTAQILVDFHPDHAGGVDGILEFRTDDPGRPLVRVHVSGTGAMLGTAPVLRAVTDIPRDQGRQVWVWWYPSTLDAPGIPRPVDAYFLWRRAASPGTAQKAGVNCSIVKEAWEHVETVYAVHPVGSSPYGRVVGTVADSTRRWGMHWSVFRVSAMVAGDPGLFSKPDSGYSVDNTAPASPNMWPVTSAHGEVDVRWDAPQDADLMDYVVERSVDTSDPEATEVVGTANSTSFHDPAPPAPSVYYRVFARDSAGNPSVGAPWVEGIIMSVADDSEIPQVYTLHQNYPNPFNPSTTIRYGLPSRSHVMLTVFNILGQQIATLVEGEREAGYHEVQFDASGLASGVYLYRLTAGTFVEARKFVLVR